MSKWVLWILVAAVVGPTWATGVHKDDITYQPLVNRLTPTFETVVRGLTLGKNEYDQLSAIAAGKTGADPSDLCKQLFDDVLQHTTNYCDAGQPGAIKTRDLQDAGGCLNRVYKQASGETVTPTDEDCFASFYKFIEVR